MKTTVNLTEKLTGVKAIHVKGNRWFNKRYGNPYHKAYISVLIDDVWHDIGETDVQYGYADSYIISAGEWLIKNGYIESDQDSGYYLACRSVMTDLGLQLTYEGVDVKRERDL